MAKDSLTKRAKRNGKDVTQTLARAGIAGIPVVGGAANELLNLVLYPSLEKRRDEWIPAFAGMTESPYED